MRHKKERMGQERISEFFCGVLDYGLRDSDFHGLNLG